MATEALGPEGLSVEALAAAMPDTRDRYVDFLRAFSIVVVVAGHWFIALIHWEEGQIFADNVLVLYPLGFGYPVDATGRWWMEWVVWLTAPTLLLAGFIWVFGRFERPSLSPSQTPTE
jgi:hypothetical protein